MSEMPVRLRWIESERLKSFVTAWEKRLTLDGDHLARLRARLKSAAILSTEEAPSDLVTLHSQVRLRDLESGRTFVWTVFLPTNEEVATTAGSPRSSLGATMLGMRCGDEFVWQSRGGRRQLRIEAVLFQPKVTQVTHLDAAESRKTRSGSSQPAVARRHEGPPGPHRSRQRVQNRRAIGSEAAGA